MKSKTKSILIILSLCSVVLIPMGLALMWFNTDWKKKIKIILTAALSILYAGLIALILLVEPANNTSGIGLPGSFGKGSTNFDTGYSTEKMVDEKQSDNKTHKSSNKENEEQEEPEERLPRAVKKSKGGVNISRWLVIIVLIAFMIYLIIRQNLKNGKKSAYENPYVDTNQYKLPLAEDAKMPIVHFLHLHLAAGEKIYFATETTQKDNEGDFAVTNQRVVILNKNEVQEFPMSALTAVSSVSNSVMMLTSGDRKYYIFMPESQLKYALAVVRWAYAKATGGQN